MIHKYHSQNCNVQNLVSTFWLSQFNHYNEYFFSHGIDRHVYPLPNILKGANLITMICAVCKVCSEKKFTHICMYYANSGRTSVKSLRSAKSRHPEDSKLVRQVLIIQKILPENVIEQKKFFCENTIFVKK